MIQPSFSSAILVSLTLLAVSCSPDSPSLQATPSQDTDMQELEVEKPEMNEVSVESERKTFVVDEAQSMISFVGGSTIIDHPGVFDRFTVTITPDSETPDILERSLIEASIDLTSAKTDIERLDAHLQREDFFDTAIYPTATFRSTVIRPISSTRYSVTGNLMIKGITKTITIEAEITSSRLVARYDLPRKEFGIGNDSYGDKILDPLVPVDILAVFK